MNIDLFLVSWIALLREPIGIAFFSFITRFADTLTVGLVLCVVATFLFLKKRTQGAALGLIVAVAGAKLTEVLLKILIGRARPDGYELLHLDTYSFPSGHATVAMALYGFITYLLWGMYPKRRVRIALLGALVIIGVGVSRVYLGVHYPSDVLGGYIVGAFWIAIGVWAMKYWRT